MLNKFLLFGIIFAVALAGLAFAGFVPGVSPILLGDGSSNPSFDEGSLVSGSKLGTYLVTSRSMEPTILPGAIIDCQNVAFDSLKANDLIVFRVPNNENLAIVSRIVQIGNSNFVVKGDNNNFLYPWDVTESLLIGNVTYIDNPLVY